MKKNHTILILIFSIASAILVIGLFIFFLKVIKNKNEHISVVLSTLEEKMKEKEDAIVFAGKVSEIKLLQDSLNSHFLNPDEVDTFVSYLEEIGSKLGSVVSVESIEIPSKTKNIISVKTSIGGTFQEVMETITYLENIPYQIDITQVYLNKDINQIAQVGVGAGGQAKNSQVGTWKANVSFNILILN